MYANALKALPLALLLAASSTAVFAGSDETSEKKEKVVIVTADEDFSDGDEPFIWSSSGHSGRGRLGVRLLEMTPDLRAHYGAPRDAGVLVAGVVSESSAAKAGIRAGDIITRAGGEHIETATDLARAVRHAKTGESIKLDISRDRAKTQVTVKVERSRDYEFDLGDLGRDLGRSLGRDFGRDLGRDISRDIHRDLGRRFGRDLGRDLRREIEREIGRNAWAFHDSPIVFRDRRVFRDHPEKLDTL